MAKDANNTGTLVSENLQLLFYKYTNRYYHRYEKNSHASNAKNLRVNKNDVNHRQEGGKTGDHFGPCRRAMFAQFKHAFQHPLTRSLGGMLMTHYLFPNKEGKSVAIVYQNETIWTAEDNFFSLYLLIRQRLRCANRLYENVKLIKKERHVPDRSGIFRLRRYAGR